MWWSSVRVPTSERGACCMQSTFMNLAISVTTTFLQRAVFYTRYRSIRAESSSTSCVLHEVPFNQGRVFFNELCFTRGTVQPGLSLPQLAVFYTWYRSTRVESSSTSCVLHEVPFNQVLYTRYRPTRAESSSMSCPLPFNQG